LLINLPTGFGDYVAMNDDSSIQTRPDYATFGLVFIFVGLAVLSSAINLIVTRMTPACADETDNTPADGDEKSSSQPTMFTINMANCQPEDLLTSGGKAKTGGFGADF
jgi:hypothetical protein